VSLWWWWGPGADAPSAGAAEVNYPSLWSGGVTFEAADAGTGTQGYWQTSINATARTGQPDIAVSVGGAPVTNRVRSANWQLGRNEWLSVLSPGAASFELEGRVYFDTMDEVVIGVISDTSDEHSAPLWVGYVDTISETTETSGRVTTSVSCIDPVGRLGQSNVPDEFPTDLFFPNSGLAPTIEAVLADAGTLATVEDDSLLASNEPVNSAFSGNETLLTYINDNEYQDNFNLFVRGDGHLVIQRRYYDPTNLDPAPTVIALTPLVHAKDSFERTEADGWGDTDTGDTWALTGTAADFDVADGWGTIVTDGAANRQARLDATNIQNVRASYRFKLSALSSGNADLGVFLRETTTGTDDRYAPYVRITSAGVIQTYIQKTVADVTTTILAASTVTGLGTYVAGDVLNVEAQVEGTLIQMRVWRDGSQRPRTWTSAVVDSDVAGAAESVALFSAAVSGTPTWSITDVLVCDLDGYDETNAPASWTKQMSPTTVINDWGGDDLGYTVTDANLTSRDRYGMRSYTPPEATLQWLNLIETGIMDDPRPLLSSADFPITDLGQAALFLDPGDWVALDGETYQVLTVQHSVEPGRRWRVSITGDTTQVALREAYA
jgi:hypothetical protein